MRDWLVIGGIVLLGVLGAAGAAGAQENLSVGRGFGLGVRYLPSALSPLAMIDVDLGLGSALTAQYWVNDQFALELGGWISSFTDQWNPRSYTNVSAGLLLKLLDHGQDDLYLVGRGISVQSTYSYYCIRPAEKAPSDVSPPDEKILPPCWSNGSRASTLAVEVLIGLEHSWSAQLTTNFEFGLIYAQTVTTYFPPSAPEEPAPKPETSAASGLGISVRFSLNFYLAKATK
ncbi:MAG: hypothetical protein NZ610_07815 [Candidatus Bipolaricaulota bacterium]|nr:hypothetical protein [Candidatus Bipolaricaulota bacterium]MCS7275286.1 hypothetical protein [Candidatus Bipolaricaulota bacterium]MDW8111534.1 hypothetical protein [Candidatus Bipolaricaulota bacterium]MDW8329422.1 hypothetical protein [Candidatus Bipolaricaulota bacterium]